MERERLCSDSASAAGEAVDVGTIEGVTRMKTKTTVGVGNVRFQSGINPPNARQSTAGLRHHWAARALPPSRAATGGEQGVARGVANDERALPVEVNCRARAIEAFISY